MRGPMHEHNSAALRRQTLISLFTKVPARKAGVVASFCALLGFALVASGSIDPLGIFDVFNNRTGKVMSDTVDPNVLNGNNKFFDDHLGTNGQSCATCHQPDQSFGLDVVRMREVFEASHGLDPLFRPNDTADRPDADVSTLDARRKAYKLALELGVTRIGRPVPATADYIATLYGASVSPAPSDQFGPLPNTNDPQAPVGVPVLSAFRRPLVNTNVHFDSAVLWDGRASVTNMPGQVQGAARTLLLAGGAHSSGNQISDADAQEVADFMLGVFTDQVFDSRAKELSARGAQGGVENLLALSQNPAAPCTPLANPATCTPVPVSPNGSPTTMYSAWADITGSGPVNERRRAIARGQEVFNTAVLHMPPDLKIAVLPAGTTEIRCTTCHANPNVGNNPLAAFLGRLGTDSIPILEGIVKNRPDLHLDDFLARLKKLPDYCLRAKAGPPLSSVACGQYAGDSNANPPIPGDVRTTDPGKATVSGLIAEAGRFKPPILRALAGRAPYFHQGAAATLDDLINFYDGRFSIHLTKQQHDDLKTFLEAF